MTEKNCDFLLVGGGQNTLTAAAYLAASGHSVQVLERHGYWGGGCITQEVTVPGFRHDLHATNVFMARANPLLKDDELGLFAKFGMKFADTEKVVSHGTVFDDGSVLPLYKDLEASAAHIARFSERDAESYIRFMAKTRQYMDLVSFAMFRPPANGTTFKSVLDASREGREFWALLNASSMDIINENFSDERVKVHLLRLSSEMMMAADAPGSGFGLMMMAGLYHRYPAGFVVGGSQGFSDALVRCLRFNGGEIHLNADVEKLEVVGGRATAAITKDGRRFAARKAIIAGIPPWQLSKFVPGTEALTEKSKAVATSDYTCFLIHLALQDAPRLNAPDEFQTMGFTVLAPRDFEGVARMTKTVARGELPEVYTASYVCATHVDPSRAPPGKHTLYLYQPVPTLLANKPLEAWKGIQENYGNSFIKKSGNFILNLTDDNILGSQFESPYDIQAESPSYQNGDVAGLAMTPSQFIEGRPIPELANYRVPGIDGLYLCGPFMHPGGGANGGGRPVAMRVLMDLDLPLTAFNY